VITAFGSPSHRFCQVASSKVRKLQGVRFESTRYSTIVMQRVGLVTGGNKGIGFEICRSLAKQAPDMQVLLGARDENRGQFSAKQLNADGLKNVAFLKIDLDNLESIKQAAEKIKEEFGGLDVLVNNAAIAFKGPELNEKVARQTIDTNYFGTLNVCKELIPLLRPNARVVVLSALMNKFVADVSTGTHAQQGWPNTAYGVSKIGESALTRIFARQLVPKNIKVNAVCPGWVRTDMAGSRAPLSAAEGAETPTWLALLPDDAPTGCFWKRKQQIAW